MKQNNAKGLSKVYTISVDGSSYSDKAIELVLSEFYNLGDKLHVAHVKKSSDDSLNVYEYEVHKVLDKFINNNGKSIVDKDFKSYNQDRNENYPHSIKQTLQIAFKHKSDLFFIGFKGTESSAVTERNFHKDLNQLKKTNKFKGASISKNDTLTRGIIYLLQLPRIPIPVVIVKESSKRERKDNKGFSWCFCIKDLGSSFTLFKKMLNFVDKKNDIVKGVHVKSISGLFDDEIKKSFISYCKSQGIKKHSFEYYDRTGLFLDLIGYQLSSIVNFGKDYHDFVICNYSSRAYYYIDNHPLYDLILNCESNIIFSNEFTLVEPSKLPIDEVTDLDEENFMNVITTMGLQERYKNQEKVDFVLTFLKVDKPSIKKRDFLSYLDKKANGERTFSDKTINEDDVKFFGQEIQETEEEEKVEEDIVIVQNKDKFDPIKELLRGDPPNIVKIKNFDDILKFWKLHEPNFRKIIFHNIRQNPVSPNDIIIVHNEVSYVLSDKKLFNDSFKDCLNRYIKTIWKKTDPKIYEDIYQELYDLLPLSNLASAKNMKELKKLFEGSHKEIVRDVLECPGITLKKEEVLELHVKILNDIKDEHYPFFERLKKSLCNYKKGGDEKDADLIMKQWENMKLILEMNNLNKLDSIDEVKEFFIKTKDLVNKNLLNISYLNMTENEINEVNDLIIKGLIPKSPYVDEIIELVNIYYDAIANKNVHDIHLCMNELKNFISRTEKITQKKEVVLDFKSIQTKEELLKAWEEDERHLIYISNDIDGLTRQELKNFHDEVYYTFAGDITSFFEMKKQLSIYTEKMENKQLSEIKAAMKNFASFMSKENAPEIKRELLLEAQREPPTLNLIKEKKKFLDSWDIFINSSINKKYLKLPEVPLNQLKIDFLTDNLRKLVAMKETDFELLKSLVQSFAMVIYKRESKNVLNAYNAVNRYNPIKK